MKQKSNNKMVDIELEPNPSMPINKKKTKHRLLIGTPTMGIVRVEWVSARFGQIIPCNWSHSDMQQMLNPFMPIGYQIADAENMTAKAVIEGGYEWFLSIEDDNVIPQKTFLKLNEYMIRGDIPIISGLYFTKSVPPEPIMYRESGAGYYADWKLGEKVWVSGIPFGCTLIHRSILQVLWDESPEYMVNGIKTRRVFNTPADAKIDAETGALISEMGTSDLAWCKRMKDDNIFEKAGWPEYQKMENPLLVDTSIFVHHIDRIDGTVYPRALPQDFVEGRITFKQAIAKLTA